MKKIKTLKQELQQLQNDIEKFNNCLGAGYYDLYYKDLSYIDDEKLKNELIKEKEKLNDRHYYLKREIKSIKSSKLIKFYKFVLGNFYNAPDFKRYQDDDILFFDNLENEKNDYLKICDMLLIFNKEFKNFKMKY